MGLATARPARRLAPTETADPHPALRATRRRFVYEPPPPTGRRSVCAPSPGGRGLERPRAQRAAARKGEGRISGRQRRERRGGSRRRDQPTLIRPFGPPSPIGRRYLAPIPLPAGEGLRLAERSDAPAERVRVGPRAAAARPARRLAPTETADPHPALRATFSHWEKEGVCAPRRRRRRAGRRASRRACGPRAAARPHGRVLDSLRPTVGLAWASSGDSARSTTRLATTSSRSVIGRRMQLID